MAGFVLARFLFWLELELACVMETQNSTLDGFRERPREKLTRARRMNVFSDHKSLL
jgi:hypothetical protein